MSSLPSHQDFVLCFSNVVFCLPRHCGGAWKEIEPKTREICNHTVQTVQTVLSCRTFFFTCANFLLLKLAAFWRGSNVVLVLFTDSTKMQSYANTALTCTFEKRINELLNASSCNFFAYLDPITPCLKTVLESYCSNKQCLVYFYLNPFTMTRRYAADLCLGGPSNFHNYTSCANLCLVRPGDNPWMESFNAQTKK